MRIFGFEIKRSEDGKDTPVSFAQPINDDGALNVGGALGGAYGMLLDIEGSAKTEAELVTRYRSMALAPEVQQAVDEVVNEAISVSSHERTVEVVLDDVELPKRVKDKIEEEFDNILRLLDFSNTGYDIFSKFYVDGRLNYHVIIDEENLKDGIKELRYLDPRKIRLVREMQDVRLKDQYQNATLKKIRKEYYIYSENGFNNSTQRTSFADQNISGLKIAKDTIVRITSGLVNETNSIVLSHLHKAIKPLNQLKMLEDANVVYTLTRAPERRVFYVDVGNLPKAKAEQYLYDMMARHKNKVVYDPATGEIRDDRKMMCYDLSTKIPLLDGRTLELREIMKEYEEGKQNWVYSCDPVTGKFYPGPVSWAGVTKKNSEVVKVVFDNGKSVICTPDHKFPVWNKGFVEAQHLTPEDSIIPGYRRQVEITPGGAKYEQIYKNDTQTWEFTHREIARWKQEVLETDPEVITEVQSKGISITSVEFIEERMEVGSLTIDRDETYHSHHTYLIDAGVYTKNTMTEDYWFPRREGNRSTEVDTLPSSGTLSDNESLMYFQTKLYKALNVPVARLQPETMYTFGRTSEITREELKFAKFIQRLRARFSMLFDRCLERQLILKGIISPEEWKEIQDKLRYDFMKDNFFEELKQAELLREKLNTLREVEDHIGRYFSRGWVRKNVLFMSDSDIEEMEKELAAEKAAGEYDDGMGDDTDDSQPETPPEETPEDSAKESLLINSTNTLKSYKRGRK